MKVEDGERFANRVKYLSTYVGKQSWNISPAVSHISITVFAVS
jgi:hypothetical protein